MDIYKVDLRIQSKRGKIKTRKTPNTDTFYAILKLLTVILSVILCFGKFFRCNYILNSEKLPYLGPMFPFT